MTNNDVKVLPITNPVITVYPGYANTLSIILQYDSGYNWFLQKYFHLMCAYSEKTNSIASEFMSLGTIKFAQRYHAQPNNILCPAIKSYTIPAELIKDMNCDVINLVKYFINKGMYLHLYVERKNLPNHNNERSHTHQIFVYGFNDVLEQVYLSDYFSGGAYQNKTCSYEEFRLAFENASEGALLDDGICYEYEYHDAFTAIKPNSDFTYEFDLDQFKEDILFYLHKKEYK